ncbi:MULTISPECIES: tail fiber domain-containing protein [Sphingobacterium]|uniref:Tail fiber domain-containing protein n=1 Tax=Sphingobacterium litopenaei TaxID=2763500 RepID=A0ABR7YB72_9SPHI|nr:MULTISPECIES: tail fiber domain-containing protein [Sphingobacterium]MBD1428551.1 tail fiber domain-containing protein [Sphingobacterium litopenaei]NGM72885.1 tail fiber domain-containing protein [Sphingobacterium sp. SGL-16]
MTIKSIVIIGAIMGFAHTANAQQIEEKELKVNVQTISQPFAVLNSLEPVTFNFNTEKYKAFELPKSKQYGFTTANASPEVITKQAKIYKTGKNATKAFQYDEVNNENLIPVLVAAIKEQKAEIEALRKELENLKKTAE